MQIKTTKTVQENVKKDFNWYLQKAERGESRAQILVGLAYSKGDGVEKNEKLAFNWWLKAAEQGDVKAQTLVGSAYSKGDGVEKNEELAFDWWLKAAEQGDIKAQTLVGLAYFKGFGIEENKEEALDWWLKAAERGESRAQILVGLAYSKGEGVEKNDAQAFEWCLKATKLCDTKARSNINSTKEYKDLTHDFKEIAKNEFNACLSEFWDKITKEKDDDTNIKAKENKDFSKVFIVHGRDEGLKQKIARLLEDQGIKPIILDEQPNGGAETIINKFEKNSNVGAAICLFTADDIGKLDDKYYSEKEKTPNDYKPRARQNVVFETGFFMAKLGRENVIIIADPEIEFPSDLSGILYTNSGDWYVKMLKELRKMNYKIDLNLL